MPLVKGISLVEMLSDLHIAILDAVVLRIAQSNLGKS
jgi:hypothetical protein